MSRSIVSDAFDSRVNRIARGEIGELARARRERNSKFRFDARDKTPSVSRPRDLALEMKAARVTRGISAR